MFVVSLKDVPSLKLMEFAYVKNVEKDPPGMVVMVSKFFVETARWLKSAPVVLPGAPDGPYPRAPCKVAVEVLDATFKVGGVSVNHSSNI
jgi:hypothetical protein